MIGKLRGLIDEVNEDSAIIDVGGVGYHIFCSAKTLLRLPPHGQAAEFIIETHVREDHIHLYGFSDTHEREWFRLLTTVQGVGVKMALAILGAYAPDAIAQTIAAQDKTALTKVSGVGPKLAERIVTELKNKAAKVASPIPALVKAGKKPSAKSTPNFSEDAVSALVNLGYNRTEAFTAVAHAITQAEGVSSLDQLIRLGLKELAR